MSSSFNSLSLEKKREVIERLYKFQDGKCFLCKEALDLSNFLNIHLDHKILRKTLLRFITENKIGDKKVFEQPINASYILTYKFLL